jgi:hypothetical protein
MRDSITILNESFHSAYRDATRERQAAAPIFILLGDELISHHRGERRAHRARPLAYHTIKTISHAPVALYSLARRASEYLPDAALSLRNRIDSVRFDHLTGPLLEDAKSVLQQTLEAADEYLRCCLDLPTFTGHVGNALLKLRWHATALHLSELDRVVTSELAQMDDNERSLLQVVVAGVHQARDRSLGTQYFHKRLPEGCPAGERVLYGEGVHDEQAALELVALQRFDREVALAFFGDPTRLQQDVLGDAAEEILSTLP